MNMILFKGRKYKYVFENIIKIVSINLYNQTHFVHKCIPRICLFCEFIQIYSCAYTDVDTMNLSVLKNSLSPCRSLLYKVVKNKVTNMLVNNPKI